MDKLLARLIQKKREWTHLSQKRGRRNNQHHRKTNNLKRILWKAICQQTGPSRRNG